MYEFATGVIDVLEKRVFDKLDQERMLKAPDKERAFEVLFDTDMGDIASGEKDVERIIERDLADFKKVIYGMLKQEETLFGSFFLKFDGLNLKIALKGNLLKETLPDFQTFPYGLEVFEKIKQGVAGKRVELNPLVEKMIEKAKAKIGNIHVAELDSEKIETIVDESYFETKIEAAKKFDPFLRELTCLEIDVANVKSLLKAKSKTPALIDGGNLNPAELRKLVALKEGEIFQDLKKFLEVFGLSLVVERYFKEKSETALEAALQSFLTEKVFVQAKEVGQGIVKILAFFYKKMNSYSNIRLILFSKENDIPLAEIEPLLLPI